jgi:AbrB family looped-hinge helix DNA binding protein
MEIRTQISKNGRIVLPTKLRKALEIQAGGEVVVWLEKGYVRMVPLRQVVTLAQKAVRQYMPKGTSLVDALIQARKEDTGHG